MRRGPRDGGAVSTLYTSPSNRTRLAIAVDATNLYVGDRELGLILSVPKSGGPVRRIAVGQSWTTRIVVDDNYVYWVSSEFSGAVKRVAK